MECVRFLFLSIFVEDPLARDIVGDTSVAQRDPRSQDTHKILAGRLPPLVGPLRRHRVRVRIRFLLR